MDERLHDLARRTRFGRGPSNQIVTSSARCLFASLLISIAFTVPLHGQGSDAPAVPSTRPEVRAFRVFRPPAVDGVLDDEAWNQSPVPTTDWLSYNPLHGDRIPQHTTVWVAYDDDYFYFAFKCDDQDPHGIKTSIARRDNVWSDDWVGLSLDSLGTGQLAYHMMVNPSGIQMDMVNSIAGGEDQAPDWIWDSAGRVTDGGYTVEIRLPLQSIRFKGGENLRMGILFWRRVSRIGVSVAWPPREVIPTATFAVNGERPAPGRWSSRNRGDLGFSTKIGLTPTVTLDATINPDFSQVESDAFQVQVNQRFPVFYPEKRPFFMEGAGIFTLAGTQNGDQSLISGVNTRNIVDPRVGAKITGNAGRLNFATLTAVDDDSGPSVTPDQPGFGRSRTFNVGRAAYSLRPGSYLG